jgi:hypothetical protein
MGSLLLRRSNDRVFSRDYDTPNQASASQKLDSLAGEAHLPPLRLALGKIRLDLLISAKLIFTDAQLLDGRILGDLAREGYLPETRRTEDDPLPVEVHTRVGDLRRSLWWMYVDEEAARARGFISSYLSNGRQIQSALKGMKTSSVPASFTGVKQLLMQAKAPSGEVEALAASWHALADLEAKGGLEVKQWSRPFNLAFSRSLSRFPPGRLRRTLSLDGRALFDQLAEVGLARRSAVYEVLERWPHVDELGRPTDAGTIREWYDDVYLRALAFQHAADYKGFGAVIAQDYTVTDPNTILAMAAQRPGAAGAEMRIPTGVIEYLGTRDAAEWREVCRTGHQLLMRWWVEGDVDALRRILDDVYSRAQRQGFEGRAESGRQVLAFLKNPLTTKARQLIKAWTEGFVGAMAGDDLVLPATVAAAVEFGFSGLEQAIAGAGKDRVAVRRVDYLDDVEETTRIRT